MLIESKIPGQLPSGSLYLRAQPPLPILPFPLRLVGPVGLELIIRPLGPRGMAISTLETQLFVPLQLAAIVQ